jgi:demethylmenaquinone methyltransferase / 2-methoxy-6-polyprenyl-1,4-benzoquinol methylase
VCNCGRTVAIDGPAAPSSRKQHALALFAGLPRHYDAMGAVLSFGQDPRWRRALVAAVDPRAQDTVLDVATGTGLVAAALVRRSGCRVVALDQSAEMLSGARARLAGDAQLRERIELVRGTAERLPFGDGAFDALTFTYLLRYVDDPGATLRELARVVRPGGTIAAIEFGVPGGLAGRLWWAWTRVGLPGLGRLVSRDWWEVGRFLGPSIEDLYRRHPLPEQVRAWREAGIAAVQVRRMSLGGGVLTWGTRDGGGPAAG